MHKIDLVNNNPARESKHDVVGYLELLSSTAVQLCLDKDKTCLMSFFVFTSTLQVQVTGYKAEADAVITLPAGTVCHLALSTGVGMW